MVQGESIPVKHQIHRRYKRIHLHVRPDHILIKSPGVPRKHLNQMLAENTSWIQETWLQHKQRSQHCPVEAFYFGDLLPVVYEAMAVPTLENGHFLLPLCSDREGAQDYLKAIYAREAQAYLPQRLAYWSERMELYPKQVRLKYLKSRWGSCSSRGNINLNYRALQLPSGAIDAILIHELAHLRHLDHGSAFWQLVHRFCPDYSIHHQDTKKLGPRLI